MPKEFCRVLKKRCKPGIKIFFLAAQFFSTKNLFFFYAIHRAVFLSSPLCKKKK